MTSRIDLERLQIMVMGLFTDDGTDPEFKELIRAVITRSGVTSVDAYGAIGDGVHDAAANTRAINGAISDAARVGGRVVIPGPGTYLVQQISLPTGTDLEIASGATLKLDDGEDSHVLLIASGATDISISGGGEVHGNKANNSGGHGIACTGTGCSRVSIRDIWLHDCDQDGIRFGGTLAEHVTVHGVRSSANGAAGITGDSTLQHFTWVNNIAWDNGSHGVGLIGTGKHGTITGNVCENNSPDTTADQITAYNASNQHLSVTGNICRGGGNNGMHIGGSDLTISANSVEGPTHYGIVVSNHDGSVCVRVSVDGNIVDAATDSGIWLEKVTGFAVGSSNVVSGSGAHGIVLDTCLDGFIGGTFKLNGADGVRTDTTCARLTINAQCFGNTNAGIRIDDTTETLVTGCTCKDNGVPFTESGTSNTNTVAACDFRGNAASTVTFTGAASRFLDTPNDASVSVASAASLTLPRTSNYVVVTGTTNIDGITGSWPGRQVTLRFDGVLTVADSGNLVLAGAFTTSNLDTLTLVCDGTDWWEVARSVN